MKRKLFFPLIVVMCLVMVACGKHSGGTYYPDSDEMKSNLENKGYAVSVQTTEEEGSTVTALTAAKGYDYIEFYWLSDEKKVDDLEKSLNEKYRVSSVMFSIVGIKNDDKFGNLAFASTIDAMHDAGIIIVDVDVKV